MNMFDNYPAPADYIPDNRPKCIKPFCLDIMSGETAIHTFEVPFNVNESCEVLEVIYKLGIKPIIIKNHKDLEIIETECGKSIVTCKLSPEETELFANTVLSAKVQLKFYMSNNTVSYSEEYKIKLMTSLDSVKVEPTPTPTPTPGSISGIAYTED